MFGRSNPCVYTFTQIEENNLCILCDTKNDSEHTHTIVMSCNCIRDFQPPYLYVSILQVPFLIRLI